MANNKEKPIRVCVAMGCPDMVRAQTLESMMGLALSSSALISHFFMRQSGDIVSARTNAVKFALEKNATHILFIDSDMKFPPDTLIRLLNHEKDIVTVEYSRRKLPIESVTAPKDEQAISTTKLYPAIRIGAGCLLIKLSVFQKIQRPWFNFGRDAEGEIKMGEDTWFALRAMDAGFPVWVDPTLKVGHVGEYVYKMEDFDKGVQTVNEVPAVEGFEKPKHIIVPSLTIDKKYLN